MGTNTDRGQGVISMSFEPEMSWGRHLILLSHEASPAIWGYPASMREECFFSHHSLKRPDCYGSPPSETLKKLIEAQAPTYVVIERLIEEYPNWAEHFEAAWAAECAELAASGT